MRRNLAFTWLVFLVLPALSFIVAVRNYSLPHYKVLVLGFLMLYGFTFIPIPDADGTRYIEEFNTYSSYSFDDFSEILTNKYTSSEDDPDIYSTILLYLSTRISRNYHIFFLLAALIYFAVALKLWETLWSSGGVKSQNWHTVFFIGTLFILNISAGVNGIRYPLGLMVFSLAALKFIMKPRVKYLLLGCLSVLVHFSLLFPLIFLLLFSVLQRIKTTKIVMLSLLFALLTASVISQFVSSNTSIFGAAYQVKLEGFTGEDYLASRTSHISGWNWYVQINLFATTYFLIIALILIQFKRFRLSIDETSNRLLMFSIVILIQCIISGNILDPITNSRYYLIMNLFGLATLFYIGARNQPGNLIKTLAYAYMPILLLRVLIILRNDLHTVSPPLVFGNILSILFVETDTSVYDMLFN